MVVCDPARAISLVYYERSDRRRRLDHAAAGPAELQGTSTADERALPRLPQLRVLERTKRLRSVALHNVSAIPATEGPSSDDQHSRRYTLSPTSSVATSSEPASEGTPSRHVVPRSVHGRHR
jgi:hypothetical protein